MKIICVDMQRDFTAVGGACYVFRPCVKFILETLVPCCRKQGIQIAEIVSDYRQPRPGDLFAHCVPGTIGYESVIPVDIKKSVIWIKSMHSPAWVRENGGILGKTPGKPYPDPEGLTEWLAAVVGSPEENNTIVLIGLTLDCCVLCTAQELVFRGYEVEFLIEAVDTFNGSRDEKLNLIKCPLNNWGKAVGWDELKERIAL